MDSLSIPLLVAVAAFLAVVLWRVRPAVGFGRKRGASRDAVRAVMARVEAAADEKVRALALCDAADLMAARGAKGLYLRAFRADPGSAEVVRRAVSGLSRRPRALEAVLWRHLGASSWSQTRDATSAVLSALVSLYEGPLRSAVRARAFGRARDALGGGPATGDAPRVAST